MLADRLVQIIRLRNMDAAVQRRAEKWTRSLNTVDWLTAQLPIAADIDTKARWIEQARELLR